MAAVHLFLVHDSDDLDCNRFAIAYRSKDAFGGLCSSSFRSVLVPFFVSLAYLQVPWEIWHHPSPPPGDLFFYILASNCPAAPGHLFAANHWRFSQMGVVRECAKNTAWLLGFPFTAKRLFTYDRI